MSRSFSVLAMSIVLTMPMFASAVPATQMTTHVAATQAQATKNLNGLLNKVSSLQANFNQTTKVPKSEINNTLLSSISAHLPLFDF